jgi:hypothetical protein
MSSSKDYGMKFELDQKVFIKTMGNKEAIITGWFCDWSSGTVSREYDVWYKDSSLDWESHYPSVMEYIGSAVTARVREEDLAPFTTLGVRGADGAEWADAMDHIFDALRYATSALPKPQNALMTTPCQHSWKTYQGFTDTFDYCEKCNCRKIG